MTKTDFYQLLKNHDWSYQHSDDPRAHGKGKAEWARIRAEAKKDPELQQMLDEYKP